MLIKIPHTASFRFALLHTGLFFASAIVLVVVLYFDAKQSLETQMRDRILAEVQQLMVDYRQDGMEELRHDIRERIETNSTNRLRYQIRNVNGRSIFDKLLLPSNKKGWHHEERFLFYIQQLDEGYTLVVGGELSAMHDIQNLLVHGMILSIFIATALALMGGVVISGSFLKRINTLRSTAELVGTGDFSRRIHMNGSGDEFDQLAAIINQMLSRIEILVQEVQHVSTNIAHDLRTPLTKIRNQLEMQPNQDGLILALDDVLGTFNSLLHIAEIESGTHRKDFKRINLSSIISDLVESYTAVAEERSASIHTDLVHDVIVSGDRYLIIQMLANLIENALKYGGRVISIRLTQESVSIYDNGGGIPEGELEHITKPFYRLDTSRSSKGNGLGLSVVAAIARLHSMSLVFQNAKDGLAVHIDLSKSQ